MREYGQIQCSFWSDPEVQSLSDDAKLLATYLLTGPHSNGLGCYRLPDGYIVADFNWTPQRVSKAFAELYEIDFCKRCEITGFVLIPKFLHWNEISNGNVAKAREKEFDAIPKKASIYSDLVAAIKRFGKHFSEDFKNRLETLSKGIGEQDPTRPDPEPDPSNSMSGKPDAPPKRKYNEEAKELIAFLNDVADRNFQPVDANVKPIVARLKEGATYKQCKQVIANRVRAWKSDPKMAEYIRPETLFRQSKFASYVGLLGAELPEEDHTQGRSAK